MLFKSTLSIAALLVAAVAAAQHRPVFTATRVFKTLTDVPPFIVTATSTTTWTAEPTTTIAEPTGPGI
ncbi:hypothetical protein R3P38DRAFT_2891761 [Favolaschia claudopus]|uniref:Uncharacterized protein n=1 Tax=Favolaschia claudopus TaxID=2862362 RepID=A0AAW0CV02_9AGAR